MRHAVLAEGVQGLREDALAVGLDNVQQGPVVDPAKVREEFERGDHASPSQTSTGASFIGIRPGGRMPSALPSTGASDSSHPCR